MHRKLFTVHCLLLICIFLLSSCALQTTTPHATRATLLLYRFDTSSFIEYSIDYKPIHEIPFSIPPNCGLNNVFPAPIGSILLIELNCPNGQTVLFLDVETGSTTQPITASDAHFLAWTSDGKAAYLKIDTLGNPQLIRVYPDGAHTFLVIHEYTYDLSAKPDSNDFTFAFSNGLGVGSELYLAQHDGRIVTLLYADPSNYISFARWSPDGRQIAFIKTPDSQIPFTVGELWLMNADGSRPRKLADVDAGHGYAAHWSPDGEKIAFVVRENPENENANRLSEALISNIYIIEAKTGNMIQVTRFQNGYAETPRWSPEGNMLVFSGVVDGRMNVFSAELASGAIKILETGSACCPAWMRK